MNKDQILFQKSQGEMKKKWLIKECFHPDKNKCEGVIKQAHSIQRNGRLSLLEEPINEQMMVYSGVSYFSGKKSLIGDFKPVGKATASTFYGFCDKHDTEVFSSIENSAFDNSSEHLFLHSYRAFAHTYHSKKQEYQLYASDWDALKTWPKSELRLWIKGLELSLRDLNEEKKKLDDFLLKSQFDKLEYLVLELGEFFPFACSSLVSPFVSVKNRKIDEPHNLSKPTTSFMMTVLPDLENSVIIFAGLPNNKSIDVFFEDLDSLSDARLSLALSSMMTRLCENTVWSPKLWDSLSRDEKAVFLNDARYLLREGEFRNQFPWSSINFFSSKYSAQNVGISK
jgi:hypothetical protein